MQPRNPSELRAVTPAERRRLARYHRDVARNYDRLATDRRNIGADLAGIYRDMARQSRALAKKLEDGNGE